MPALIALLASCTQDETSDPLAAVRGKTYEEQADYIMTLYERDDPEAGEAFVELRQRGPQPNVRAYAAYVQAFWLMKDDRRDPDEVLAAFETVLRDHSEVPHPRRGTPLGEEQSFAEALEVARAAVEHAIGKMAPEIEASGMDGEVFRLSDYRGRVVMLDFWAHWCGGCVEMLPWEVELVARLEDAPFALVGVNGDPDLEAARALSVEKRITWRSFWNGPGGAEGPITAEWVPRGWPTIYLIDHTGRIRHKQVGRPGVDGNVDYDELDRLIDELITAALDAAGA